MIEWVFLSGAIAATLAVLLGYHLSRSRRDIRSLQKEIERLEEVLLEQRVESDEKLEELRKLVHQLPAEAASRFEKTSLAKPRTSADLTTSAKVEVYPDEWLQELRDRARFDFRRLHERELEEFGRHLRRALEFTHEEFTERYQRILFGFEKTLINLRDEYERSYLMPAELVISGIAATFQAVQTWLTLRDRGLAARQFEELLASRQSALETKEEARALLELVPSEIVSTVERRTRDCWNKYHEVLLDDEEFLPREVDEATEAVKRCICRELKRLRRLSNGQLPDGDLRQWWEAYCSIGETK